MNILLTSVGRRPYLVRWFQEALKANSLKGNVIASDVDPLSPARYFADEFVEAKRVGEPNYFDWLGNLLAEREVDLAVSINDFELSEWALLPQIEKWKPLVRLSSPIQTLVEDKYAMGIELNRCGIPVPLTWLGSDRSYGSGQTNRYVTKGRFGSASRGLRFADSISLEDAVTAAAKEVTNRQGQSALEQDEFAPEDLIIVQEQIVGTEYGLDVVCDLTGAYAGVLARRKIAMRSGETDRAESVASEPFEQVARQIAAVVPHPGTIDLDIIVDSEGVPFVIDINPRFGGGYPFSHLAGANVPNAYVAWMAGRPLDKKWLRSEPGVVSGKYVETVRIA